VSLGLIYERDKLRRINSELRILCIVLGRYKHLASQITIYSYTRTHLWTLGHFINLFC